VSFLGIDIGQTGCKVIAFSVRGQPLASAYREYPIISDQPGQAELDSAGVVQHCKECIAKVAAAVQATDPVSAMAVSSQGEAFTVIGPEGEYLSNAMITSDIRCELQVGEITERLGRENLYRITGHSPHTMFTLFKLAWLRQNRPEILDSAWKILCFEDLLGYELTGEAVTDYSMAGWTMMLDVTRRQWSGVILDSIGIEAALLPEPRPSGCVVGSVKKKLCEEIGLTENAVVVTGGHDQPCGALGAGVIGPGVAMYSTGTADCISPAFDRLVLNDTMRDSNLATYHHVVHGLYFTVAFNLTGGNLLRWFRDEFGRDETRRAEETDSDPYELLISQMPTQPTRIMVLPHFAPTGTPYFDVSPTGEILGLKLSTTRGEFIKALLEGTTYEMKLNVEILARAGVEINQLRAIGGGAKSAAWMQIKANIMDIPIVAMQVSEAACMGAAMLSAVGSGAIDSIDAAVQQWVRPARVYEPSKPNAAKYRERYGIYRRLYDTIKPIGQELSRLT